MKKLLCIVISLILLLLCGCGNINDDNLSTQVEIIYEEETIYDGENAVTSNTTSSSDKGLASQSDTSNPTVSEKPDSSIDEEPIANMYYLNDVQTLKNIKLNGRCEKGIDGIGLNFAASAIEFNIDGGGAVLDVEAQSDVFFSIFVDNKLQKERYLIQSGTNYVILTRDLPQGKHNIKFVREGESKPNTSVMAKSIQLYDENQLLSKDGDNVLIEFLGDSMTSGYGNLILKGAPDESALKSQNSLKAYPYIVACKFNLDYRIVSLSGIALRLRTGYPTFYDFYCAENYHKDKSQKYTSSNPKDVDIVVVNLGTNDVSAQLLKPDDPVSVNEYSQHYADLITKIGYNTNTKIVFVSGVMWCHSQVSAYEGAKTILNSKGYNNVYLYDADGYNSGGGGHPSVEEHKKVADEIIKFFKANGIV